MVSQLKGPSGQWNAELIQETFTGLDADLILRMPLCNNGEDFWAWELERHGNYSVKSAYKILADERERNEQVNTPGPSDVRDWRKIRKLVVPPKVKVFWW
ncbi:hypothetical protein ACP70R_018360 [Stipagrostis hirtigluma subsp. patula]